MTLSTPTTFLRDHWPMAVVIQTTPFIRTYRDVQARLEPGTVAQWVRVYDSGHVRILDVSEQQEWSS